MKKILFILCLFSCCLVNAQFTTRVQVVKDSSQVIIGSSSYQELWKNHFQYSVIGNKSLLQLPSSHLLACAPNHLPGLFCKMEYKIETKSKLAPRFRLGSLNYTNWMEGKGNLYNRYLN